MFAVQLLLMLLVLLLLLPLWLSLCVCMCADRVCFRTLRLRPPLVLLRSHQHVDPTCLINLWSERVEIEDQ